MSAQSSMPQSGAEVADVELGSGTDLGRGRGRRIERGLDGRHESEWGTKAGGGRGRAAEGGVCPEAEACSALSKQATQRGDGAGDLYGPSGQMDNL
jgi:hypothetical protein